MGMTREQVADIMRMLMASLRMQRPVLDDKLQLDGWEFALHDLPPDSVMRAAALILREDRYFPEPSRVRELALQGSLGLPDIDQAWARIAARINHQPQAFDGLSSTAADALVEAVEALGGWYTLRHSERPERDRDTFYKLWPEIRQRTLRQGLALPEPSALRPPATQETRALPPGVVMLQSGDRVLAYRVPGEDEAAGWRDENYANVAPKPVPRAILGAPPSRAEKTPYRAERDPEGTGEQPS